jgi:DNA-binding XRE family transcriptional regulator
MGSSKESTGRPTKYKAEFDKMAEVACRLGATDSNLAELFGVTEQTINNWKKDHPSFFESLKAAKATSDDLVKRSLFERATGYSHPEDKIFNNSGEPMIVPSTKHHPPDVTACIFWLKNRDPDNWRANPEDSQAPAQAINIEIVNPHGSD